MSSVVSVGACSDITFDDIDLDVGMAVSDDDENGEDGETDYDIDSEEIDEEEEDEDDSGEDESQIHALIDDLEVKFRTLVTSKISEAERFFDDGDGFRQSFTHSTLLEKQINASESVANLSYNDEGIEEGEMGSKDRIKKFNKSFSKESQTSLKDMSTQTDINLDIASVSVAAPVAGNNSLSATPEQARVEIGQLRDVRESLIVQRQQWATQLKQAEATNANDDDAKAAECKVYEIEEAIEALDTAIEFKNEIVLGQPPKRIVASDVTPGSSEVELVTRLESLSIEELRRLLCAYFAKVVELRRSSRRLEKHLERQENFNDHLNRRLVREHKRFREIETEYNTRIRTILRDTTTSSNARSLIERLHDQLATAQKKQHDLERSLTELLVRHGYLVNGADYDVKQVVRMLGIESQLAGAAGNAPQERDYSSARRARNEAAHSSRSGGHKMSSRGESSLGHRRNGRILDGDELSRIHRDRDRDVRMVEELERAQRQGAAQQAPEVRREKNRLIIHPSNGASTSAHHGSNSHHNHHYSHVHHHSAHGTNHPRYK